VFSDTINNVEKGYYRFTDGTESSAIYLENGFDINLILDTKEFDESINYTGNGSDVNNYLAKYNVFCILKRIEELIKDNTIKINKKYYFHSKVSIILIMSFLI